MASIDQVMSVVLQCKDIDFSAVSRDQAVAFVKTKCTGFTDAQTSVVVSNVLGPIAPRVGLYPHQIAAIERIKAMPTGVLAIDVCRAY